jgi:hypothetical protein
MTGNIHEELIPQIISSIRYAGGRLSDRSDAIYMDDELEELLPDLVSTILQYPNPHQTMIQVFDIVSRLVDDPDVHTAIREMKS